MRHERGTGHSYKLTGLAYEPTAHPAQTDAHGYRSARS